MVSVTHRFRSTKADAADSSLVKPSDWNDDHDIALTQRAVLGRLAAGPGSATEILLGLDDDRAGARGEPAEPVLGIHGVEPGFLGYEALLRRLLGDAA